MKTVILTPAQIEDIQFNTSFDFPFDTEELSVVSVQLLEDGRIFFNGTDGNTAPVENNWTGIEFSELQAWANLADTLETGDVVVNENEEEFLRHEIDGEDYQIFCQKNVRWSDGWVDSNGEPEKGVTKGEYYLVDGYNHWSYESAVWCKNSDCNTPYVMSDFKWNGSFIEKRK